MLYRLVVYKGATMQQLFVSEPCEWSELEDVLHAQTLAMAGERVRFGVLAAQIGD